MKTIFVQLLCVWALTIGVWGGHVGFFPTRKQPAAQPPLLFTNYPNYGSPTSFQVGTSAYQPTRHNVGLVKPPGQSQPEIGVYPVQQQQQQYQPPFVPVSPSLPPPGPSFSYEVNDPESGNHFGHHEDFTGNGVSGRYFVRLPNGLLQTVIYVADQYGYRPQILYQGKVSPIAY